MAVAAVLAAISIVQTVSGILGGIMDKDYALKDAIKQYTEGLKGIHDAKVVNLTNRSRAVQGREDLPGIQAEQNTQLREEFEAQSGRNIARLGVGAISLRGSPIDIARRNKRDFRSDEAALERAQKFEAQALQDEVNTYDRDFGALERQEAYLIDARDLAKDRLSVFSGDVEFNDGPVPLASTTRTIDRAQDTMDNVTSVTPTSATSFIDTFTRTDGNDGRFTLR